MNSGSPNKANFSCNERMLCPWLKLNFSMLSRESVAIRMYCVTEIYNYRVF